MNRGKKWFSEKLWKHFVLENFWSESFSISTSCIESSRFRARVAKGKPAFRDRITRRNPRVQNRISKGRFGLRNSKKYFRLIMIRVTWIVEKSGFQNNFEKFCLRKFLVRVILDTYLLYRELPLPSSCCKGEACLPRSHYRGGTSSPKLCIEARGRCALWNWDSDICPTHVPKKTTSVRNFDIISIQRSSN